ncbi:SDR family NAD(P)-dependent oxidoreductase [Variovorax sp. J22P168]|nr:SDR family NAD(P)-dependent oxidoreductase [Variovorax sp. J22P168]
MRLTGKTAVVTGASRGIGLAIADAFAREGASVVLADLDEPAAAAAASDIAQRHGVRAIAFKADVASQADNQALIDATLRAFGTIDIVVCNAGIVRKARPIEEITPEQWRQVIDINLMGCVYATQAAIPHLKAQRSGRIIYMASVAGEIGGVSAEITYSVSKAGVLCLTKAVAKQLGAFNVTVNAIAPGTIETAMTDVLQYDPSVRASVPLGRYGDVEDIAQAAVYLACEDGKYLTGTTLDVNGGLFMR